MCNVNTTVDKNYAECVVKLFLYDRVVSVEPETDLFLFILQPQASCQYSN